MLVGDYKLQVGFHIARHVKDAVKSSDDAVSSRVKASMPPRFTAAHPPPPDAVLDFG